MPGGFGDDSDGLQQNVVAKASSEYGLLADPAINSTQIANKGRLSWHAAGTGLFRRSVAWFEIRSGLI
jgi:hypothetical protein